MAAWTKEELAAFENASTLQNQPFADQASFEENNPVWEFVVDDKLYIRGAKVTKNTKWYLAGTQNGGQIAVNGQDFRVKYQPVTDAKLISQVTAAYQDKYHGQYPIDLMVFDKVAQATVELVKE